MNVVFFIAGNHEDPKNGNPIGYYRMTQRSKHVDPAAKRYQAWQRYVQQLALEAGLRFAKLQKNGTYELNVICWFKDQPGTCRHADPENVRKGIQDALFQGAGDQHVWGMVMFYCSTSNPGAGVVLRGEG